MIPAKIEKTIYRRVIAPPIDSAGLSQLIRPPTWRFITAVSPTLPPSADAATTVAINILVLGPLSSSKNSDDDDASTPVVVINADVIVDVGSTLNGCVKAVTPEVDNKSKNRQ